MLTRTISARKALTTLAIDYNGYSMVAAYWRRCEHDAYKTNADKATALLEIVTTLFRNNKDYKLTFVSETLNGVEFEWRKMEVL